jgi:hypothetical protein
MLTTNKIGLLIIIIGLFWGFFLGSKYYDDGCGLCGGGFTIFVPTLRILGEPVVFDDEVFNKQVEEELKTIGDKPRYIEGTRIELASPVTCAAMGCNSFAKQPIFIDIALIGVIMIVTEKIHHIRKRRKEKHKHQISS